MLLPISNVTEEMQHYNDFNTVLKRRQDKPDRDFSSKCNYDHHWPNGSSFGHAVRDRLLSNPRSNRDPDVDTVSHSDSGILYSNLPGSYSSKTICW